MTSGKGSPAWPSELSLGNTTQHDRLSRATWKLLTQQDHVLLQQLSTETGFAERMAWLGMRLHHRRLELVSLIQAMELSHLPMDGDAVE